MKEPRRDNVQRIGLAIRGALMGMIVLGSIAGRAAAQGPARLSGLADQGVFRLYVNEEVLVTTEYKWEPDGSYEGRYVLAMAGQQVETLVSIEVNEEGEWTEITLEAPTGRADVVRKGMTAQIVSRGQTTTVALKPNTVLFENFSPALLAHVVRAYDLEKGGAQTLPVFILPGALMDGTLELLGQEERAVGDRDMTLTKYSFVVAGVKVIVFVDERMRPVYADVPQQHAAYVREGYEVLRASDADSLLSQPQYAVRTETNVMIPMRDGVRLATDIYRPEGDGKYPVVLVRTPYKKEMTELQGKFFARRGYVYAAQDCRGRFSSEGEWEPFVNEPADGYDTIEWLATQPWSNGRVGMIGASYLGWVQWWAAREAPPHLVTIIPNVAPPDPLYNVPYEYGVFFLLGAIWWADILETEATADISGKAFLEISEKKYEKLLRHLPVVELDEKVLGKKNPYWRKWIEHPQADDYWERASFLDRLENVRIPVFHQSGWFDGDGIGTKLNYLKMVASGHPYQKLVVGPWAHTDRATRRLGDIDFGEEAVVDLQTEYLRWLDHWLKGIDNGIEREPLVSVFVMGSNKWLRGDTYPLPQTVMTKFYLSSDGRANTSKGDGRLVTAPPPESPPDRYVYDPSDPTPSPAYYVKDDDADSTASLDLKKERARAYYAEVDERRQDILVYDTPPLEEPLTFVGPVSAVLYAASSAVDTDWFVRLARVDESGRVFPLVEGKIRARYRNSLRRPELLKPGAVYEYRLDLWHTGVTIMPGERLRVEVASASFPVFSRNLNTGLHNETTVEIVPAEQTIYHNAEYPSHVVLPVIPGFE